MHLQISNANNSQQQKEATHPINHHDSKQRRRQNTTLMNTIWHGKYLTDILGFTDLSSFVCSTRIKGSCDQKWKATSSQASERADHSQILCLHQECTLNPSCSIMRTRCCLHDCSYNSYVQQCLTSLSSKYLFLNQEGWGLKVERKLIISKSRILSSHHVFMNAQSSNESMYNTYIHVQTMVAYTQETVIVHILKSQPWSAHSAVLQSTLERILVNAIEYT